MMTGWPAALLLLLAALPGSLAQAAPAPAATGDEHVRMLGPEMRRLPTSVEMEFHVAVRGRGLPGPALSPSVFEAELRMDGGPWMNRKTFFMDLGGDADTPLYRMWISETVPKGLHTVQTRLVSVGEEKAPLPPLPRYESNVLRFEGFTPAAAVLPPAAAAGGPWEVAAKSAALPLLLTDFVPGVDGLVCALVDGQAPSCVSALDEGGVLWSPALEFGENTVQVLLTLDNDVRTAVAAAPAVVVRRVSDFRAPAVSAHTRSAAVPGLPAALEFPADDAALEAQLTLDSGRWPFEQAQALLPLLRAADDVAVVLAAGVGALALALAPAAAELVVAEPDARLRNCLAGNVARMGLDAAVEVLPAVDADALRRASVVVAPAGDVAAVLDGVGARPRVLGVGVAPADDVEALLALLERHGFACSWPGSSFEGAQHDLLCVHRASLSAELPGAPARLGAVHPGRRSPAETLALLRELPARELKVFSQNGEDGILHALFALFPPGERRAFAEFGVEDGTECNSRLLRELGGWRGLAMDGSNHRPEIGLFQEWIFAHNIVELFEKYAVSPTETDLVSVDLDYNDLWVLRALLEAGHRPRVVVVEVNGHVPADKAWTVPYDPDGMWDGTMYYGASAAAMRLLGRAHGYSMVYCGERGVNCFLVRNDLLGFDAAAELPIEEIYRPHRSYGYPTTVCRQDGKGRVWTDVTGEGFFDGRLSFP